MGGGNPQEGRGWADSFHKVGSQRVLLFLVAGTRSRSLSVLLKIRLKRLKVGKSAPRGSGWGKAFESNAQVSEE